MARVARLQISKEFFEIFLRAEYGTSPNMTIETNAPKDLEVLGLAYPLEARYGFVGYPHTLEVVVKSESFEDIPECCEPPLIDKFIYTVKHGE